MHITPEQAEQWWHDFTAAWARQNVDATLTLFTPDATYQERWYAEPVAGHDGLRAYWQAVARTTRDVRPGHEVVAVLQDMVIARWWVAYQLTDGGKPIALEGVALVEHHQDGRAHRWREWFDAAPTNGTTPVSGTSALPQR